MGIPEKIEEVMKKQGVSRYKLSKDTGIPYTTLTQILNGRTKTPSEYFTGYSRLFRKTSRLLHWKR
ncbi:helix-turn-helix domain-containing protein [Paenibacillus larvae]